MSWSSSSEQTVWVAHKTVSKVVRRTDGWSVCVTNLIEEKISWDMLKTCWFVDVKWTKVKSPKNLCPWSTTVFIDWKNSETLDKIHLFMTCWLLLKCPQVHPWWIKKSFFLVTHVRSLLMPGVYSQELWTIKACWVGLQCTHPVMCSDEKRRRAREKKRGGEVIEEK